MEVHHIIEKRFYKALGLSKSQARKYIACIPLDKDLHKTISKRVNNAVKNRGGIWKIKDVNVLREICNEVYKDMPELKKICNQVINNRHRLKKLK